MVTAARILEELRSRGVRAELAGGRLRTVGPKGAIGPELAERVRTHRAEVLELLRQEREHLDARHDGRDGEHLDGLHPAGPPLGCIVDAILRAGFRLEVVPTGLIVWDQKRRRPDGSPARGELRMPTALFFDLARRKDDVRALLELLPGEGSA